MSRARSAPENSLSSSTEYRSLCLLTRSARTQVVPMTDTQLSGGLMLSVDPEPADDDPEAPSGCCIALREAHPSSSPKATERILQGMPLANRLVVEITFSPSGAMIGSFCS